MQEGDDETGVVVLGLAIYFFSKPGPKAPERRAEQLVMVQPLPPPPPPKVRPSPPPTQKLPPPPATMEKQAAEVQPAETQPKNADDPSPSALATGIQGDGPGIGLASSGRGIGNGSLIGGGAGGGGSQWGIYGSQVQSTIAAALRANPKTRTAVFSHLEVRIWPDATGRIKQVKLGGSTGNEALDDAIQNRVLSGLQLSEPPPAGLPLPIVLRVSAQH